MISTKGRYALRVIVDLAQHQQGDEFIPLKDIAARQEISEKYLEIILKSLVKNKLLKGLRGKGGGYRLTRQPEEYTIGEILYLTEGTLAPVACLTEDADPCARAKSCSTLHMWKRFDSLINDFFNSITIADLMEENV
ncbi:MAG: Rrf2 family transcriptional regulator [Lachnospiraceae bacterium]|nr:Rrf2 family transcriptional regulator [Lachnospiraceae bacterium]